MFYLDAIENVGYFDNIEKVLSSIGLSISDAVMTFFNSGGVQNKDVCIIDRSIDIIIIDIFFFFIKIIDQCGHLRIRRQTYSINQKIDEEYSKTLSLSLLDRQLISISRSLNTYRSFWMKLPEQICKSTGVSARNGTSCWTGTSISHNGV
jgi:hypothetical protein